MRYRLSYYLVNGDLRLSMAIFPNIAKRTAESAAITPHRINGEKYQGIGSSRRKVKVANPPAIAENKLIRNGRKGMKGMLCSK